MTVENDLKTRMVQLFKSSPYIQGLLEIIAIPLQDSYDACTYLLDHTNLDDLEGEHLDQAGESIGVYRPKRQEEFIFTLCRAGEVVPMGYGFTSDDYVGGYMWEREGLASISNPGPMDDEDYLKLIRQKAASFRQKATDTILFLYLLEAGGRCLIDDTDELNIWFEPIRHDDFDNFMKNYLVTRGFKPAGIRVRFENRLTHKVVP